MPIDCLKCPHWWVFAWASIRTIGFQLLSFNFSINGILLHLQKLFNLCHCSCLSIYHRNFHEFNPSNWNRVKDSQLFGDSLGEWCFLAFTSSLDCSSCAKRSIILQSNTTRRSICAINTKHVHSCRIGMPNSFISSICLHFLNDSDVIIQI